VQASVSDECAAIVRSSSKFVVITTLQCAFSSNFEPV
jgi:hypothetical protein